MAGKVFALQMVNLSLILSYPYALPTLPGVIAKYRPGVTLSSVGVPYASKQTNKSKF